MRKTILFIILFTLTLHCFSFVRTNTVWEKQLNYNVEKMLVSKNYIFLVGQKKVICMDKKGKQLWEYRPEKGTIGLSPVYDNEERLWLNTNDLKNGNVLIVLDRLGKAIFKQRIPHCVITGKSYDGERIYFKYGGKWMHIYGGDVLINQKLKCINPGSYILSKKHQFTFFTKNLIILWTMGIRGNKTLLCIRDLNEQVKLLVLNPAGNGIEKRIKIKGTEIPPTIAKNLLIFVNVNPKTYSHRLTAFTNPDFTRKWDVDTGTGKIHPSFANNCIYFSNPFARGGWDPFVRGILFEVSLNGKKVTKIFKSASPFSKGAVQLFMTDYGFQYKDFFVFPTIHEVMALNKLKKIELVIPDAGASFLIKSDGKLIFLYSVKNREKTIKAFEII